MNELIARVNVCLGVRLPNIESESFVQELRQVESNLRKVNTSIPSKLWKEKALLQHKLVWHMLLLCKCFSWVKLLETQKENTKECIEKLCSQLQ
jgi:hypothetical protein